MPAPIATTKLGSLGLYFGSVSLAGCLIEIPEINNIINRTRFNNLLWY